jgi:23S rRNA (cytosine1962-C5)-methyltransferase
VLHARLTAAAVRQVKKGHPWVFDQSITHLRGDESPGELTALYDEKRKQIGLGLYDPASPIRVRVLHRGGPSKIDDAFFDERVREAIERRASLEGTRTDGYRVIHGENDGLGGLIVDRYADTVVVKLYSEAWVPRLSQIVEPLKRHLNPERVVLRLARRVRGPGLVDGAVLEGPPLDGPVRFRENGLLLEADPVHGQKTGFFLDQRDNRAAVERRCKKARVLNVFSYSGGFSLYAARGGARAVASLDLSQPALDAAARHFEMNRGQGGVGACEHELLQGDAFVVLEELARAGRIFDVVIVDPPSFAKRQSEVEGALRSYAKLMRLALAVLDHGGQLIFASCSSRVSAQEFRENAERAARKAGRPLTIEEETGHALDHPCTFDEGAYLKCLYCRA